MKRRGFITLVGGVAAWPVVARDATFWRCLIGYDGGELTAPVPIVG